MISLTGGIVALVGVLIGFWWTPFLVGAAIGIVITRAPIAVALGALTGVMSWLLPLLALEVRYGIGSSALSLAEIMGFGRQGTLPVVLTLVVGALLGLTGAWLACALRVVVRPAPR